MLTSKHYTIYILSPSLIIRYAYLTLIYQPGVPPEKQKWVPIFYYRPDSSILYYIGGNIILRQSMLIYNNLRMIYVHCIIIEGDNTYLSRIYYADRSTYFITDWTQVYYNIQMILYITIVNVNLVGYKSKLSNVTVYYNTICISHSVKIHQRSGVNSEKGLYILLQTGLKYIIIYR